MSKTTLATAAALAAVTLFDLSAAQAADLGSRRAPIAAAIAAPADLWTGFYVGAHAGYRQDYSRFNFVGSSFIESYRPGTAVGGLHAGYNWLVTPNFLLGLEAAGSYGNTTATFDGFFRARNTWDAQFRVRAGYVQGPWLLYAAAGLALLDQRVTTATFDGFSLSTTKLRTGWTVGAGVEYAIDQNWRVRGEYLYANFGGANYSDGFGDQIRVRTDTHTLRFGVSYRFATGGPVSARY